MAKLTTDQRWNLWVELHRASYAAVHTTAPPAHALRNIWDWLGPDRIELITDAMDHCRRAELDRKRAFAEASKHFPYVSAARYQQDDFEFAENEASFFDYMAAIHKLDEIQGDRHESADTLAFVLRQRLPYYDGLELLQNFADSTALSAKKSWERDKSLYQQARRDLPVFNSIFERKKRQKLHRSAASQFPVNGGWCGSWELGSGSFGTASAWVKTDAYGNIFDRVVIKDSYGVGRLCTSRNCWHDPEFWTQDPANLNKKLPNEIVAMSLLRGREGSENIVRIRGHRLHAKEMFSRIFMEYAPYGDCSNLPGTEPPESFVWAAFEALAIAGLLMAYGELTPSNLPYWKPLVHRDIKPENLFLGWPLESRYRGFPSVKLGDWGLALFLDPTNPLAEVGNWGTEGCKAPEHDEHVFDGESWPRTMTERTNVWEVANTIWTLIAEHCPTYDFSDEQARMPDIEDDRDRLQSSYRYSPELRSLIMRCMQFKPEHRCDFRTLLGYIRAYTAQGWYGKDRDLSGGLRDAPSSADGFGHGVFATLYNKFALNTKRLEERPNVFGTGVDVGSAEEEFGGKPGTEIKIPATSSSVGAARVNVGSNARQSTAADGGATEERRYCT